jgi:1-acyl-sn-glycerol-3-phosphate acyltransferase
MPSVTPYQKNTDPATEMILNANAQLNPTAAEYQPEVLFEAEARPLPQVRRPSLGRRIGATLLAAVNFVAGYLMINVTSFVAVILFRLLNRTRIYGRWNVGVSRNTLLCSNHRTMIDSYQVGLLSSVPFGWIMPWMLPYHPAAKENFFRNRIIGWFSWRWRCIPVRRGIKDMEALRNMTAALRSGHMCIFPEGTRSRTGELKEGRPGTGKLIHDTQCKVVPIYHSGMENLLPVGTVWPRIFRRIELNVGKPIDMSDLFARPSSKETSRLVIARVMEAIAELKAQSEARAAARVPWYVAAKRGLRRAAGLPLSLVRRS